MLYVLILQDLVMFRATTFKMALKRCFIATMTLFACYTIRPVQSLPTTTEYVVSPFNISTTPATTEDMNLTATVPTTWSPEIFPNPQTQPYKCGRRGKPGFICDPNNIISDRDHSRLDEMIDTIRLKTPCPCDSECPPGKEGHLIGIAIMKRMDLPKGTFGTFEELQLTVERFATYLRTDSWHFSHCTNDAVIVISVEDKTIFTSPGPKARERLHSRCIDKAFLHARFKFSKEQYFEGLATILSDYKLYIQQGDCPGIEGPSIAGIVLGSLFLSIVVICVLFCIYECITRRRAAQRRRRKFDFSSSLINTPSSATGRSHFKPTGCLLPAHERSTMDNPQDRPPRPPPPQLNKTGWRSHGRSQQPMRLITKNDEQIESIEA